MHETPSKENNIAFTDKFRQMVDNNDQVYTAVKKQGTGYAIDTAEHTGNVYVVMFSDSGMAKTKDGSAMATIGLANLIKSCYSNPHIMGVCINPYDEHPVYMQRKDLQIMSGIEDPRLKERNWGEGIPEYTDADIMVAEEAVDFAMEFIAAKALESEGFELVESNNGLTAFPNFVLKKDDQLYFVAVDVALAPKVPNLKSEVKDKIVEIGNAYNAKVLYAPVSFASSDPERAEKGLALVGDEFIGQFIGFVMLN